MKVLLVNTYHYLRGGDCTYTFNLADLLRSKGHAVKFFGMKHPQNLPTDDEKYFLEYIDYVELNKNKTLKNSIKVLTRSIYYRYARVKIAELIMDFKPDIVHLQNIHAHITPSIIFEVKKHKIPVVWTLHDYKLICPNSHFLIDKTGDICEACKIQSYYQPILKRCKKDSLMASIAISLEAYTHKLLGVRNIVDKYISPSIFLKNKLIEYGYNEKQIFHLSYFLKDDNFKSSTTDGQYILYFGRINFIKGIIPLLASMKTLKKYKLVVAGMISDNVERDFYNNLSSNVEYVGTKYGNDLRELIKNATVIVVPSLWYENQPFSILEAFACGKPVIASSIGGMKELVEDGIRGYLVPPGDVEALSMAIDKIMSDRSKALEMGENAYNYVIQNHSADVHYTRLMELYEQLISKS